VTEAEKIAFPERVRYELAMLNYTFMRIMTVRPSNSVEHLDRDAFLESFAIHARNLVFLSAKTQVDDRNATDYVTDFEASDQSRLQQPLIRLEQQSLNVTASQATDARPRFSVDDARELYTWIVPALLNFEEKLAPEYRASLNALGSVREPSTANRKEDRTSGR
jgi:hypothetical protein